VKIRLMLMALIIMPIIAVGIIALQAKQKGNIYGSVPEFRLKNFDGKTLERKDFNSKIWVANFIFTSCSGQCPNINGKMKRLEEKFGVNPRFRLASFTVDPQRDTVKKLASYAKRYQADPKKWAFVTGEWSELQQLLEKGFAVAGPSEGDLGGMITHSMKIVLVDGWGRIRGYFDGTDEKEVNRLTKRVQSLLLERF